MANVVEGTKRGGVLLRNNGGVDCCVSAIVDTIGMRTPWDAEGIFMGVLL
jgi:hypothetical protein